MNKYNTLVTNLLAGPGAGKSTFASNIFAELKWRDVDCELVQEYAKDLTWEKRFNTLKNQIHVFGEQHHRIFRLLDQVEVIVTDSPLLLTPIYAPDMKTLTALVLEEFEKLNCLNVFIKRHKKYNPNGRNQNKAQAIEIDEKIKSFLSQQHIPYIEVEGTPNGIKYVVDEIILRINK